MSHSIIPTTNSNNLANFIMTDKLGRILKRGDLIVYGCGHGDLDFGVIDDVLEIKNPKKWDMRPVKMLIPRRKVEVGPPPHYNIINEQWTSRKKALSLSCKILIIEPGSIIPDNLFKKTLLDIYVKTNRK